MLEAVVRWTKLVALIAPLLWSLWIGIRYHRGSWQRRDWMRFGLALSAALSVVGVALAMGVAVDRGIYDEIPVAYHSLYGWTLLAFILVGSGALGCVLGWFIYPALQARSALS